MRNLDGDDFVNLPNLNQKTHADTETNGEVGFVVKDIEQHNKRLEHAVEHRANA